MFVYKLMFAQTSMWRIGPVLWHWPTFVLCPQCGPAAWSTLLNWLTGCWNSCAEGNVEFVTKWNPCLKGLMVSALEKELKQRVGYGRKVGRGSYSLSNQWRLIDYRERWKITASNLRSTPSNWRLVAYVTPACVAVVFRVWVITGRDRVHPSVRPVEWFYRNVLVRHRLCARHQGVDGQVPGDAALYPGALMRELTSRPVRQQFAWTWPASIWRVGFNPSTSGFSENISSIS